jgi:hypothetical protein
MPAFTRKYNPDAMSPSEQWISRILEPVRRTYKLLGSADLFMSQISFIHGQLAIEVDIDNFVELLRERHLCATGRI